MRESVEAKARQYVAEGRLLVTRVDERGVRATCRGSDSVYVLGLEVADISKRLVRFELAR